MKMIGIAEIVSLPELGIKNLDAKIDTGAYTASLHAFDIKPYNSNKRINFSVYSSEYKIIKCDTEIFDIRHIVSSNGEGSDRFVIKTKLVMGKNRLIAQFTLANRDSMKYKILIGRATIKDRFIVNPNLENILG